MMSDSLVQIVLVGAIFVFIVLLAYLWIGKQSSGEYKQETLRRPNQSPRRTAPTVTSEPSGGGSTGKRSNWLVGIGGDVSGKTYHIGSRTVTVGRDVNNHVQITDHNSSRVHCRLNPAPGGLQVTDLGSANGTYVNDEKINARILKDGDEMRIGGTRFVYRLQANYNKDDGLAGKAVGGAVAQATMYSEAQSIGKMARQALNEADGDIERAAEGFGLTPEVFKGLLD